MKRMLLLVLMLCCLLMTACYMEVDPWPTSEPTAPVTAEPTAQTQPTAEPAVQTQPTAEPAPGING